MIRRRRAPPVLRACIGIFLLLFSTVAADTIKGPPLIADKVLASNATETSSAERGKPIPNKIPSRDKTEFASTEDNKGTIDSYNATKRDPDTAHELIKDAKAEGEEKVAAPIGEESEVEGIRSRNEVDRLSTLDSTNGGSRFEEILYGTSGKSSSTKTAGEDIHRLSRTNDLTAATAKPASDESRLDEKVNETISARQSEVQVARETNKTAKTLEDGASSKEELAAETANTKADLESSSKEGKSSALKLEKGNFDNELTTQGAILLEEFQVRTKKAEDSRPMKNSEVADLEKTDENDGPGSLINDTNVNYSHRRKTSTEKGLESGENQSTASENATNFISKDVDTNHRSGGPKGEVEVVGNLTDSATQRVVEQPESLTKKEVLQESGQGSSQNEKSDNSTRKTEPIELIDKDSQQKLVELTTERANHEGSTLAAISSPVPRGRTIAFSGVNEFPGQEPKPTAASKVDSSFSKKNISMDKTTEQKPYPYSKSTVKDNVQNFSREADDSIRATTEESSALENTIGREQSEEKFIVTEASDVLENSIQQFKPAYHEKPANESSTASTLSPRSSLPMTTVPLVTLQEADPTNQSVVDVANGAKTVPEFQEKSTNTGNDVPRWSEGRETITGKGNFDVTGNGITEVSSKPESANKRTYGPSPQETIDQATSMTASSTLKPQTEVGTLSDVDAVQTNVESSLLFRSTLDATEVSTEYPLLKGNFSETDNKLTVPITSPVDSTTTRTPDSTESPTTVDVPEDKVGKSSVTLDTNGTNEIPSGLDRGDVSTTTGVEYEFVGLSETTTFLAQNVTEEIPTGLPLVNATSMIAPTVQDGFGRNSSQEASTMNPVTFADHSLVSGETEVPGVDDDRLSSTTVVDQTIVPTSMSGPTTQFRDDFTTLSSAIEAETDVDSTREDDRKTGSVTESWTTTTDDDVATVRTEQLSSSNSKDSHFVPNVTEASVKSTVMPDVNATDATRATTSIPVASSSLGPRILEPVITSTPTVRDTSLETTADTKTSPSPEEITSLVRIVVEGSWDDVCPKMDKMRMTLAELLATGINGSVSDKQIIFHQDPCREPPSSTPAPEEMPLTPILVYVVDENGKFDSGMTNSLPGLYKEFQGRVKFPATIHSFLLVQETIPDSGNAIAVIVVSSVAFICLVLLAGLLFIMRKRQTRFNYGERCRPVSLDAYSVDSVSAYNSVRRKGAVRSSKRSYGNPTFEDSSAIPSHPLNFAGLSSFCNDTNAINEEFSGIPQVSAKIDELPPGAEVKNRYANVIPLPETRVPLQKMNNNPLTEYINASYVRGPKNATRYYIACQAPMESTITDFWRMIWEQQCKVIIMLTDLVENGVEKCTEYIPPSEISDCHRLYGDFQVTLKKRETKEKYAISTLHLKNLENNTFRELYHIWYLWPVNGIQSDGAGLIAVLLEARALQRGGPGPIVVHCSPGTGRTGTLIALDLGIRQYEITRTVDVPRVVYTIRRDRAGAVQTKEQYAFIYKALNLYATKLAGGVLDSA
ncbi:mucin-5AC isoform X1 [Hylaeus volcanicus]|uniref:mucin-5AC isoform X1 n=1 Tax=Hylaeus volcanicus TaxID=313075 RepID=UPI0023B8016A|nr:mucin-5AC isoform X1 [Hylaeus volcanicus]XP_053982847.1 mucin-5AC isoform X1 [Hylaeus volcanicus]